MNDTIGLLIGFTLTLLIYSYLIGDNPLFRLGINILVGVSGGYAGVVVLREVILPVFAQLASNPVSVQSLLWLVPILLALLLILQRLPGFSWLGDNALALLIGVGMAVALVGAITGTLLPQALHFGANMDYGFVESVIVAVLTICTLLTFTFTGKSGRRLLGTAVMAARSSACRPDGFDDYLWFLIRYDYFYQPDAVNVTNRLLFYPVDAATIMTTAPDTSTTPTQPESYLIAEIGNTNTTAVLFDVAAGSYRLLARGVAPTTVSEPRSDIMIGVLQAIRQIENATGRKLLNSQQKLTPPSRQTGEGVDKFAAITSAAASLNTLLVGLFDEVSLESARHALHTTYTREIDAFSLNDTRNEDEKPQRSFKKSQTLSLSPAAQTAAPHKDCCGW